MIAKRTGWGAFWPWGRTEERAAYLYGLGYTDGRLEARTIAAETGDLEVTRLSIVEAALGAVCRPFLLADVNPAVVDGVWLFEAVRRMALDGDACFEIRVLDGGRLGFRPFVPEKITGPLEDPDAWMYRRDPAMPILGTDVVHVCWARASGDRRGTSLATRADRYLGRSGSLQAIMTMEKSMTDEAGVPVARVIPVASETSSPEIRAFQDDLAASEGDVLLGNSQAGEPAAGPRKDLEISAVLRPDPSTGAVALRKDLEAGICAGLGVPLAILRPDLGNIDLRESSRLLLNTTIKPLARAIALELSRKIERPVEVDVDVAAGADLATRARALKGLVDAGMTLEDAKEVVGV